MLIFYFIFFKTRWSAIATHLPGRTDNEIKNFWNTHLKKKLINMGIDPMTHQPRTDLFSSLPQLLALASLIDQQTPLEEHALKLQAEAIQLAKLQCLNFLLQSTPPPVINTSTPTSSNSFINNLMETPSLINSTLMDNHYQTLFSNIENDGTTQLLHQYNPTEPQVPFLCQTHLNNSENVGHAGNINPPNNFPWILPSSTESSVPPPPVTDMSPASNPGDASSTSSYGGGGAHSSNWPELLLEVPDLSCMRSLSEEF